MRKLIHDIHRGKKLDENLVLYRDRAVQTYCEYGVLELTFSAYTLVEELTEEKTELAEKEQAVINAVLQGLDEISRSRCDYSAVMEKMKGIRGEITAKMDLFTAYTDRLICYEYVLNRMELKYLPAKELNRKLAEYPEEEFLARIRNYLFGSKDQSVLHDKLRLVVGQIPAHMTKEKLFERIGEALTLYRGGERSALDDFLYVLRTSAMLYEPQKYVGEYKLLEEDLRSLEEADYTSLSESEYDKMTRVLERAAQSVHEMTDFYYGLQKVVNGIYAMCLVLPYVQEESALLQRGRNIWNSLSLRQYQPEMLSALEGRIEICVEKTSYLESVLYEIISSYEKEIDELSMTSFFESLSVVVNLLSDSLFIDLDRTGEQETADAYYVEHRTQEFLEELTEKWKKLSRPVRRAVTGLLLEKLPMTFQNSQEVQEYLRVNLLGCQDKAEKVIVMTMLSDLMQEEQEWS